MRTITGEIIVPEKTPAGNAGQVIIIEVQDISLADAPSQLIAEKQLDNVALKPHGRINFSIPVPEVGGNRTLTLQVHILHDASNRALEELGNELGMSTESSASFDNCRGEGKVSLSEKSRLTQFCISFSISCSSEHDLLDLLVEQGSSYYASIH